MNRPPGSAGLAARLRERAAEIEQTVLTRAHSVADPTEVEDPEYALGLREAVGAAIEYAITAIETGQASAPVPERLCAQACAAARNGVSLDTVLRRYSAGYSSLGDFLITERAEGSGQDEQARRALQVLGAVYDRLVATISEEYAHQADGRPRGFAERRAESARMLLCGQPVDLAGLRYELDAWHLAAIADGPGAGEALRDLAAAFDRSLLLVRCEEEARWAWLGGPRRLSGREVLRLAVRSLPTGTSLALGEPGRGVEGWRFSHRQAKAAMSVAQRGGERCVRYGDVALLACALADEVLGTSLRDIYLAPLERGRDRGGRLVETLHAYFGAGRNASSAAASLGVSRQTVSIRLRAAEEKIGQPLDSCAPELETALGLRDLKDRTALPG